MFFTSGIGSGPSGMSPWTPWIDIKILIFFDFLIFFSILLINLSQTAYFDDLTIPNGRKLNAVSMGMNIIFIAPIGCSFMPGEGPISVRPGPARSGSVRPGPARAG